MGNSRWRLETSINLALLNAKKIGLLDDIEIIVTDWGSEVPLSSVLSLINEAERRVKFINIPTKIAEKEQKDSKFPEVIALNVAARRATGDYIGRIDNDTIVGRNFSRSSKTVSIIEKNYGLIPRMSLCLWKGAQYRFGLAISPFHYFTLKTI